LGYYKELENRDTGAVSEEFVESGSGVVERRKEGEEVSKEGRAEVKKGSRCAEEVVEEGGGCLESCRCEEGYSGFGLGLEDWRERGGEAHFES
jgi:hypothetical protein